MEWQTVEEVERNIGKENIANTETEKRAVER